MTETRWFRVADDATESAGEVILSGWFLDAIASPTEWFRIAVCPRCFALVTIGNKKQHPISGAPYEATWNDKRRAHERWHAATDFPIPEELR